MLLLTLALACSGGDTGEPVDENEGACGDASEHDVTLVVKVVDGLSGDPLEGIEVVVDDRGWTYEDLATGTTGADGTATLDVRGVTDLPDCWGTVLDYVLEVSDPTGFFAEAEEDLNSALYNGIHEWGGEADLTASPVELEPA